MNSKVFLFGLSMTAMGCAAALAATTYSVSRLRLGSPSSGSTGGSSGSSVAEDDIDASTTVSPLLIDDMTTRTRGTAMSGKLLVHVRQSDHPYSTPPFS